MDPLEKEDHFSQKLLKIIHALQWGRNKIDLIGSSSLSATKYKTDFDLNSNIKPSENMDIYPIIIDIIKKATRIDNVYFIEIKIQYMNDRKIKHQTIEQIKEYDFEDVLIDYIKLDFICFIEYNFREVSINYFINSSDKNSKEYIKELNKDYKKYVEEGRLFKALKRKFSIFKLEGNKHMMVELMKFFNSETGAKYRDVHSLECMKALIEFKATNYRKVKTQLGVYGIDSEKDVISKINDKIKELNSEINESAKLFL